MQRQRRLLAIAALAGLGLASAAAPAGAQPAPFSEEPQEYRSNKPYQTEAEREQRERDAESGEPADEPGKAADESPLSVTGGVDFRDHYFFRGYNYVSAGLMAQPYVVVGYTVYQDERLALTPHGGAWFNFTEDNGPNPPTHFSEFRGDFGLAVETGKFLMDFQYLYRRSPSDNFEGAVHEVGVDVRYDDRWCWRGDCPVTGLNPSFSLFYEARDERDDDHNTFVGLGLEPTLQAFHVGKLPVTVSFPLTVGGSYDGYYQDDDGHNATLGYYEAGVRAALPLGKSVYGPRWSLDAEVDYIRLLADSAEAANGHDADDVVFRVGFSFR